MVIIKFIVLLAIFIVITKIGMKIASKYEVRASNLRHIKKALKILETKVAYTYDLLPDLFMEIARKIGGQVRRNV